MSTLFEMVGAAFVLIMVTMFLAWVIYLFRKNATIVDLAWTLSFILVAIAFFFIGDGALLRRIIITAMIFIWAGRLHWHLWSRYKPTAEDPRYSILRQKLGAEHSDFKFLVVFLFQGLIALALSFPLLLIYRNDNDWSSWEAWGFIVWTIGVTGEYFADKQLQNFKSNPDNAGKVCDKGLWYWTRHPNYFFEWLVWIGFALFAFDTTLGWLAISAPIIMYYLLNHLSGIPPTEELALKNKGQAYKQYQESTSPFFPWLKK